MYGAVANKFRHTNIASLRTAFEAAFTDMDIAALQQACEYFRPRPEAII